MTTIISISDLEVITRTGTGSLAADTFASRIVVEASGLVCDTAGHPEWETTTPLVDVPRTAKRICLALAKRSFQNPERVVQEGSIGPLGGDRVDATQALFLELTDGEIDALEALQGDGTGGGGNGLWLQPITGSDVYDRVAFVHDDSGSDWAIPMGDFDSTDAFVEEGDVIV